MEYRISVILFERSPGEWVAQCLEYDIGAQADSLPNLFYELQKSLAGHVFISLKHGKAPFECLAPAPQEYWRKWEQETYFEINPPRVPFRTPGSVPRVKPTLMLRAA